MCIVKRQLDGSYQVVSGARRVRTQLTILGRAYVYDVENDKRLCVGIVSGQLMAVEDDALAGSGVPRDATIKEGLL